MQAWVDAFENLAKVSFEQVRPLIGMGGDQVKKNGARTHEG